MSSSTRENVKTLTSSSTFREKRLDLVIGFANEVIAKDFSVGVDLTLQD
jgi:hypothetical protein